MQRELWEKEAWSQGEMPMSAEQQEVKTMREQAMTHVAKHK